MKIENDIIWLKNVNWQDIERFCEDMEVMKQGHLDLLKNENVEIIGQVKSINILMFIEDD